MKVVTHNGVFHADEVMAIAILRVFNIISSSDEIVRTRDHAAFAECDYCIDVGGVYDPSNKKFDHHQLEYTGGLSSAGMVWETVGDSDKYPSISELVNDIDEQDTGVKRQEAFHFCNLISGFNNSDVHSAAQKIAFENAINMAETVLRNLVASDDVAAKQKRIAEEATLVAHEGVTFALATEWTPVSHFIGRADFAVSFDRGQELWSVQQVPTKKGEFGGKYKLLPTEDGEFVHKNGFIGKFKGKRGFTLELDGIGEITLTNLPRPVFIHCNDCGFGGWVTADRCNCPVCSSDALY